MGGGGKADGGLCLLAETYGNDSALTGALRGFRDRDPGAHAARPLAHRRLLRHARPARHVRAWLDGRPRAGRARARAAGRARAAVARADAAGPARGDDPALALAAIPPARCPVGCLGSPRQPGSRSSRWFALVPGRAHAGGYQPYWENSDLKPQDDEVAPNDPSLVRWHAGIRVGPYLPGIDSKLGLSPGPFAQMFKGARPMPMLDVDRILWTGFGQVGVGVSIGYMQWFRACLRQTAASRRTIRACVRPPTPTRSG